jgi:hypothetical protein
MSAQQNIGSSPTNTKSAHLNLSVEFRGERARRAHQNNFLDSRGALELLNTMEGKLFREGT